MSPAAPEDGKERLQVVLARFGLASRRGVVALIEAGRVTVNGEIVLEKGFRVDASKDRLTVDDKPLAADLGREKRYFVFHKPMGVMTTLQDPNAPKTVADFFKDVPERLFPVGRLDRDTTGLLLLTNDGELAFRLMHPRYGVKKRYDAVVRGAVNEEVIRKLEKGVALDEETRTAPCEIHVVSRSHKWTKLTVTLHEGKKRQIRRMFDGAGHRVLELHRSHYGPLALGEMKEGDRRELRPEEVRRLKDAVGLGKS